MVLHYDDSELKQCFDTLNESPDCRAIVLSGSGKMFTAGLDLKTAMATGQQMGEIEEDARRGHFMEKRIQEYQACDILSIHHLRKIIR